jgi:hypothetical protein
LNQLEQKALWSNSVRSMVNYLALEVEQEA